MEGESEREWKEGRVERERGGGRSGEREGQREKGAEGGVERGRVRADTHGMS